MKEIAGLITRNIRQVDLPARYSGDVLAVIFINSGPQSTLAPIGRIRQSIEKA